MNKVAEEQARIDLFVAKMFEANPDQKSCCTAGCSACCSEAVYASEAEVLYIIENLSPLQLAEARARLPEWLVQTQALRPVKMPDALDWRELNAPCVFLRAGFCSIYPFRPMGCRTWFAKDTPANCDLPQRKHQKFLVMPDALFKFIGPPVTTQGRVTLDHLGVLLAEHLLRLNIPSGSRRSEQLTR